MRPYFRQVNNRAPEFYERAGLHGKPNSVEHEPCRLLSDAEGASYFIGTDAVLAVRNHPNSDKPLVERKRGILKDSSDFGRELTLSVDALALPLALILEENNIVPATGRADYFAIRPAEFDHELEAVVGVREVNNGLLECLGLGAHIVPHKTNSRLGRLICQVYCYQNYRGD